MTKDTFTMQNFKVVLIFLFGISIGALIWGVSMFFLQKTPIVFIKTPKNYSFYPINLTHLFFNKYQTKTLMPIATLKGIKLKGVYYDGQKGFVIIEDKNRTYFIDLNKRYRGYKLVKIGLNYAIFEKNQKEYKIVMKKEKTHYETLSEPVTFVPKKTFLEYKNNLSKIWKNIGIIKTENGYKITFVNKNSIFYKIGLRNGDILLEVNGRKLKNDDDAWDLYNNADKFEQFEIKILRNNQIKVLNYEMD